MSGEQIDESLKDDNKQSYCAQKITSENETKTMLGFYDLLCHNKSIKQSKTKQQQQKQLIK